VCVGSTVGEEMDMDGSISSSVEHSNSSCLVVRQRCLRDVPRCSRPLSNYRLHCRENKKLDQCIASDW